MNANRLTVLIVDDERVVREGCRRILMAEGFEVLVAESGEEAVEVVKAGSVHLVVADLKLPGMNGLELLAWTRNDYSHIPVIVITGHAGQDMEKQCAKAGALGLINKPFRSTEMVEAVRAAL